MAGGWIYGRSWCSLADELSRGINAGRHNTRLTCARVRGRNSGEKGKTPSLSSLNFLLWGKAMGDDHEVMRGSGTTQLDF